MKCWHMALAISRVMEKVVVVVVVMIREGSLGSGPRFDCENLSDARFWAASSLGINRKGVSGGFNGYKVGKDGRCEGIRECSKKLLVARKFEGDNQGGEKIQGILEEMGQNPESFGGGERAYL